MMLMKEEHASFDCPHTVGDYSPVVIHTDGRKIEKTFKEISMFTAKT